MMTMSDEDEPIDWFEVARSFYFACGAMEHLPDADFQDHLCEKYSEYFEESELEDEEEDFVF